ncbi:surface antigen [Janibacter sp. HTCC2649]|nr:surface antigen [Janibacter sp. HTCC2649]
MVKSLVGLGLASSVAAAVAIPVQAAPSQVQLSGQTSALVARDRSDAATGTSRSTSRASVAQAGIAVTAPAAAESVKVSAGPAGVTAVAKPAPKVEPVVDKTPDKASDTSSDKKTSTSTSTAKSVPSGVGSGAYVGWCSAKGLGPNASTVCSAVRSNFGITNIGGFRAGAGDHGTGKAVDVMVAGSTGDAVAQWAINHMGQLNITYVIWKQRIWLAGASSWRSMEDRGSVTANHYDHVHISVE